MFAISGPAFLAACFDVPADVTRHKPLALAFPGPSDRRRSTFSEARLLHVTQLSLEVSRAICALVSRAKNSSNRSVRARKLALTVVVLLVDCCWILRDEQRTAVS